MYIITFSGFIFDVSDSYDLPFYVAGSMTFIGGVIVLTLAVYRRHSCGKRKNIG